MNEPRHELNIRELAGEIEAEISMAAQFQDHSEEFEVGSVRFILDTEAVASMLRNESQGFSHAMSIMMAVLARHCNEILINCAELPVSLLPNKQIERFGAEEDDDSANNGK